MIEKLLNSENRPEWLRSSTRLVLVLFAIALIVFVFMDKVSGEQFMTAWGMVAVFFFSTRRKDGTLPEDKKNEE